MTRPIQLHEQFYFHALNCPLCKDSPIASVSQRQCIIGKALLVRHLIKHRTACFYCFRYPHKTVGVGLRKLAKAMLAPLRVKLDYSSIVRRFKK
jgi:hypothetical protein